ncbi:hypothetical protein [Candidatus Thiosymbion oneisti]|uniref:hypothetical protein n=1 Tax=Candidatus Thiosymbion oneisti TaxID=589554 RepID=UPI0010621F93|nr:hypothetical protein [Candidatus Thiosymbion oneisti]
MPYQNIDASLSAADIKAVKDAFDTVLNKLPFLVSLTTQERKATFKTGPDSVSFVRNALTAAQDHPTILPASFEIPGFEKDVELFTALTELGTLADSVASQLDDTRLAVGGEAMQEAIQVYDYVKTAAKRTPGLKPVAEQLGERFQHMGGRKQPPAAKE